MSLGLRGRISVLQKRRDPAKRLVDVAVQFHCCEPNQNDLEELIFNGRSSPIYGGCYDRRKRKIVGPAGEHGGVLHVYCSDLQLDALLCEAPIIEASGGRGWGKSELARMWWLKKICQKPGKSGRSIAPTSDLMVLIWEKLLGVILEKAPHWIVHPKDIHEGGLTKRMEIVFANHYRLQFRSGYKPSSVRGAGVHDGSVDEAQDISAKTYKAFQPSVRLDAHPQILHTLTPDLGDSWERHKSHVEREKKGTAAVFTATSWDNIFVGTEHIEESIRGMDRRTYRIEVLGDWNEIERMYDETAPKFVFRDILNEKIHVIEWPTVAREITGAIAAPFGVPNCRQIIGVDPNSAYPNYGTVWKVIEPDPGEPAIYRRNRWVVIDTLYRKGHMDHFADDLISHKYGPGNTLIIIDSSARYSKKPLEPSKRLKQRGFTVIYAGEGTSRNPDVADSVRDCWAMLDPVRGPVSMFFALQNPSVRQLWDALMNAVWTPDGKRLVATEKIKLPDGSEISNNPHIIDSWRYPVSRLAPAVRFRAATRAAHVR